MSDDNKKWCQNPRCPEKKTSSQIRGTKGQKFYQSNTIGGYREYGGKNFCTLRCYDQWADTYMDRAIDTLGIRIVEPVKLSMENSWSKGYNYHWNNTDNARNDEHFLENKLMNIKIPITEHQYNSIGWSNSDCMALANTLRPKQSA